MKLKMSEMKNDVCWYESWYKTTINKRSGGLSHKKVPSKLEIQYKMGLFSSFDFG